MQVVLNDTEKNANYCTSNMGTLSLFFNIAPDSEDENDFWNFLDPDTD